MSIKHSKLIVKIEPIKIQNPSDQRSNVPFPQTPITFTSTQEINPERSDRGKQHNNYQALTLDKIPQKKPNSQQKQDDWVPSQSIHQYDSSKDEYYLASGHVNNFKFNGEKILKKTQHNEIDYYSNNSYESPFNLKCFGSENGYLIFQNLLDGMEKPSVIDIKLGRTYPNFKVYESEHLSKQRKTTLTSSEQLGFRISGYAMPEVKKYNCMIKQQAEIKRILDQLIYPETRKDIITFIRNLKTHLENYNRIYQNTSLIIISSPRKLKIKWIDFRYWTDWNHPDVHLIDGLVSLAKIIQELQ